MVEFSWFLKDLHSLSTVVLMIFSHCVKAYQKISIFIPELYEIIWVNVLQHVGTGADSKGLKVNEFRWSWDLFPHLPGLWHRAARVK